MLLTEVFKKIGLPPDGQQEYSREALQPLFGIPGSWTQLLREVYSLEDRHNPEIPWVMVALDHVVNEADDTTWGIAWESGFVSALGGILTNEYFCGFTEEQLVGPEGQDETILHLIVITISLFLSCLCRLLHFRRHDDPEFIKVLDILQYQIVAVYDRLWHIRTPFLVFELVCFTPDLETASLHKILDTLASAAAGILEDRRQFRITERNSRIPHVLFLIWIHNSNQQIRSEAISRLPMLIDGPRTWLAFLRSISSGCTSRDHITRAMMRDFKDENIINRGLFSVTTVMIVDTSVLKTSPQLRLALQSLAAARRQLCLGDHADPLFHTDTVLSILGHFTRIAPEKSLSDTHMYSFLGLVSQYCMHHITSHDTRLEKLDQLIHLAIWCLSRLRHLDQEVDNPKVVAIRRYTLRAWQSTVDELNRRRLAQRDRDWKRFSLLWQRVGTLIPPVPDSGPGGAVFEVLQRCGWSECLCSVHRPAHRLKVCKGCWVIAYCSPKCQTDDWEKGEHQKQCRKRGGYIEERHA